MPTTPWRIAAQSYTVLDPDTKEPAFTLSFIVDHGQADVSRLRMTPADPNGTALEMEFTTGGFVIGEPIKQPRWLKAFERPDPNLYLDDEKAAEEYHNGLAPQQQDAYVAKRDGYLKRRKEWEKVHGADADNRQAPAGNRGPDSTDPNSPEAERARSAKSGVENTSPSDEDRKGMISQPPGGMAGEAANIAGVAQQNAPNAVDQQLQRQGETPRAKTLEELNVEARGRIDKGGEQEQPASA